MEIYRRDSQSPQPLLVNARDAARMLAVCERTIYNLVERGELSIIHIGRATRFAVADLRAWIQSASEKKCEDSENAA